MIDMKKAYLQSLWQTASSNMPRILRRSNSGASIAIVTKNSILAYPQRIAILYPALSHCLLRNQDNSLSPSELRKIDNGLLTNAKTIACKSLSELSCTLAMEYHLLLLCLRCFETKRTLFLFGFSSYRAY